MTIPLNNFSIKTKFILYFFLILIISTSCLDDREESTNNDPPQKTNTNKKLNTTKEDEKYTSVNFYLENSGSMKGYATTNSDFKKTIVSLTGDTDLKVEEDSLKLNYISGKITPSRKTFSEFNRNLTKYGIPKASSGSSDINGLFDMVLKNHTKNSVSVLVTDAIYSVGKSKDPISWLETESTSTRNNFVRRIKSDNFSTCIVKMSSNFNGNYYNFKNPNKGVKINQIRPYYIFVFGESNKILSWLNDVKLFEKESFKNNYFLTKSIEKDIKYTIIPFGNTKNAKFNYLNGANTQVHNISEIELSRTNNFDFGVAVNLDKINFPNTNKVNLNNYFLTSKYYSIDSIQLIDDSNLDESSNNFLNKFDTKFTHILNISSKKAVPEDLIIKFKNDRPFWIDKSGIDNDTETIGENTTFGFHYLASGIIDAYNINENSNNIFQLILTLNL